MEKLQLMMNTSWAASFGETILHSLWQGALILGIYLILSRRFRNSQQRVNLGLFALLGQLAISLITFFVLFDNQAGNVAAFQSMSKLEPANFSMNAWISANSPYLYAAWLIGFTFLCIKYFLAYFYVLWLKNSKSIELSQKSQLAVEFLKKQLTFDFENVKIVESAKVNTAMVLGHLKPVILLPIALVNRLSIEQVEVVLAHE
jgi:bla regulator protein blaR1